MLKIATASAIFNGPFRLVLESGQEVTPKSALRQAILAVLISAPGQIKGRKAIQNMFWGESEHSRSGANLRSALSEIKKDLRVLGQDVIRADRRVISIAPNRISKVLVPGTDQEILEGMDLSANGRDLFEDWLREIRISSGFDLGIGYLIKDETAKEQYNSLGILETKLSGAVSAETSRSQGIIDFIVQTAAQVSRIAIYDLRKSGSLSLQPAQLCKPGSTFLLQSSLQNMSGKVLLQFQLLNSVSRRILWMSNPFDINIEDEILLAVHICEQLLDTISSISSPRHSPDLLPWAAITSLFSLDTDKIVNTDEQLSLIAADEEQALARCLQTFTQIFRENEGLSRKEEVDPELLINLLDAIAVSDPLRPLCESLIGYSAHMLSDDNKLGSYLVEQAYRRSPHLVLNLDHLAVMRLAENDIIGADKALLACLNAGAMSPWRYSYDVTGAMISLASGDVRQSLSFANQALFQKPKFVGALRYAMVGFALADNPRDAHRMKIRIKQLRPDYDLSIWLESILRRYAVPFGRTIAKSFMRNELLY